MSRSEDSQKRQIVQNLFDSGRVYFFPEETKAGFVLVSNLSTAILVCLQDLKNPKRLDDIIDAAMEYPLTEIDTEVLQAISHLRFHFNQKEEADVNDNYSLLALYCYLADMVTLYPNHANPDGTNITFLQACREANLTLKLEEKFYPNVLQDKFRGALRRLGIIDKLNPYDPLQPNSPDFVSKWVNDWEFQAFGELNTTKDFESGSYNKLARAISRYGGIYLGVGECISYARGNRDHFDRENPNIALEPNLNEIMLSRARNLAGSNSYLPRLIDRGLELRRNKLKQLINENPELQQLQTQGQDEQAVEYGKKFMRSLLESLPLETLRVLDSSEYAIAHVNQGNLQKIYPKNSLPSFNVDHMTNGRLAAADTLSRYRIILDSNGLFHPNPQLGVLQQRLIHESAHIAFGNNGLRKFGVGYQERNFAYEQVRDNFAAACANLIASNDPAIEQKSTFLKFMQENWIIENRSLHDIIDLKSTNGNYDEAARKEEMMVECLALAYTEFSDPNQPNNIFGNYGTGNPVFDNFRAALAGVRHLYCDSAKLIQENAQQQQIIQRS